MNTSFRREHDEPGVTGRTSGTNPLVIKIVEAIKTLDRGPMIALVVLVILVGTLFFMSALGKKWQREENAARKNNVEEICGRARANPINIPKETQSLCRNFERNNGRVEPVYPKGQEPSWP